MLLILLINCVVFDILIDQSQQHLGFGKGIAIASLNANGLRKRFDEIQNTLFNLGIHIVALNETKLDDKHPEELTGYQQVRLDRTRNGGGVSICIRESIKFRTSSDIPKNYLELICIEIEPPNSKPFPILAWYRPPSTPVDIFFMLEKVISYFDRADKENSSRLHKLRLRNRKTE